MKREEFRAVLEELSKCDEALGEFGLHVFYERGSPWWPDFRLLVRYDVIPRDKFPCLETKIRELGLGWTLVDRENGPFLQIFTIPAPD